MSHNSAQRPRKTTSPSVIQTPAVVDVPFLWVLLAALVGWLHRQQQEALAYLLEENRVLRLRGRRLGLSNNELDVRTYGDRSIGDRFERILDKVHLAYNLRAVAKQIA